MQIMMLLHGKKIVRQTRFVVRLMFQSGLITQHVTIPIQEIEVLQPLSKDIMMDVKVIVLIIRAGQSVFSVRNIYLLLMQLHVFQLMPVLIQIHLVKNIPIRYSQQNLLRLLMGYII